MKRVICLYRVSTIGQVDHDDIPMQKLACREYAATHPDWEIVDEISEKGVSGYKVSTNARDAIVEIKKRAITHQFDVLLVFMFDRLGRRDDETPFVVQWFVQQGIEVWSTREGEQRFDTHVDKLLNYIRFWQASGESEKTAIRVRTKHSQMIQEGQWRGGLVPYGYRLEFQGRTNKKNKPVRDLMIDEEEGKVVREIFHLLTEEGYGTNRVAQYLNDRGIKTKRGTTLWRGTSIRALIDNPVYIGVLKFGDERSEPFEHLRLIDDATYERCLQTVKGRSTRNFGANTVVPVRTDSRSLLSGILFCADCGCRLSFNHQHNVRTRADGTSVDYEYETYRCYRKISSRHSCNGPSSYEADPIIAAVESEIRSFLARIHSTPEEKLVSVACSRNAEMYEIAYRQAVKDYEKAQKQVNALEEEAVKALTGESQLDLKVVNAMLLKHREKLEAAQREMEETRNRVEQEDQNKKATKAQVDELRTWGEIYDGAKAEIRHMIIGRLVERIDVEEGNKITIKYRVSFEQFMNKEQASA
jgi:DNA invertase Pin-like site-specific DNA recombinase